MTTPLTLEEFTLIKSGAISTEDSALPLNRLIASLGSDCDWKIREFAADQIGTLARDEDQREILAKLGTIPPLSVALKDSLKAIAGLSTAEGDALETSFKVVRAIGNMSYYEPENSATFFSLGTITDISEYLNEMVRLNCLAGAKFAVATTGNLASDNMDVKKLLGTRRNFENIAYLMGKHETEPMIAMFSIRTLGNLCNNTISENTQLAIECGAHKALIAAGLTQPTEDVICCGLRTTCLSVIDELCFTEENGELCNIWIKNCVDAGLYTLLFDYSSKCPYPDSEVDDEEEEDGTCDKKSLSESASEMFMKLSSTVYAVEKGLIPILQPVLDFVNGPVINNRRRLLISSARHDISRAIPNACSISEPFIKAFMDSGYIKDVVPMINNKDLSIKINAISIIYVLCTTEERCLAVTSFDDAVFVKILVTAVRESVDSDAIALRALSAIQNLCVPPSTRKIVRKEGFVPALAGFLEKIANPILLFGAVISARYLISDCSEKDVIDECIETGVIANIALLAKGEKGVPDPSKSLDDDGKEGEEAQKEQQQQPKEKDMRVSYEATRILARIVTRVPEAREKVLALPGVAEGFTLTLESKFDVLKTETSEALRAVNTDPNSDKLKSLLCSTPEAFAELFAKTI